MNTQVQRITCLRVYCSHFFPVSIYNIGITPFCITRLIDCIRNTAAIVSEREATFTAIV